MLRKIANPVLLSVTNATVGSLICAGGGLAMGAPPPGSVLLWMPPVGIIQMKNGQSISGVRLLAVSSSEISYVKGGKRFLPASVIKGITFYGTLEILGPGNIIMSMDNLPAHRVYQPSLQDNFSNIFSGLASSQWKMQRAICSQKVYKMFVDLEVITLNLYGRSLTVMPAQLPKGGKGGANDERELAVASTIMNQQETSQSNTLVLHQVRFDKQGYLQIEYKACSPES
jgi:hypothetical protein